jgi:hypothetical protein
MRFLHGTGGKTIEKCLPARDSGAVQAFPARLSYPELIMAVPDIAAPYIGYVAINYADFNAMQNSYGDILGFTHL